MKKINQKEGMWIAGFLVFLIAGLWQLWNKDFPQESLVLHIKFFYSILLFLAVSIVVYFVIWKLESKTKKEKKENGKKK